MTIQADSARPTVVTPTVGAAVPQPRVEAAARWAPAPFDALAGHPAGRSSQAGAPPAGLPPWGLPGSPGPVPPPSGPSTGRVVGIVAGVAAAVVALLVVVGLALTLLVSAASPATPSTPAPTQPAASSPSAPSAADRAAVQRQFNAAGLRLDRARTQLDTAMTAASDSGDRAAFNAATADFAAELRIYRRTVAGLEIPADQQQAVTSRLLPLVDATIADCEAVVTAGDKQDFVDAAGRFDSDWKATADMHNQINELLSR